MKGWTCKNCGRSYSPYKEECRFCNEIVTFTQEDKVYRDIYGRPVIYRNTLQEQAEIV